jgi:HAD superfamily phosphatase (TIGR01668 family)
MRNSPTGFIKRFTTLFSWLLLPIQRSQKEKYYRLQKQVQTLAQIEINQIKTCGIKGIILDLDNTIISENDRYLSPAAEDWIIQAKLAGLQFFILSNGNRSYRVKFWAHRLDIPSLSPAKKPFPSAFRHAMGYMRLSAKQVVVIGDSLHTDIVGAWLCGCRSIQVASLPHPPRWWEKLFGKWVQTSYPQECELWKFNDPIGYERFF